MGNLETDINTNKKIKTYPRDFFLNVGAIISLYISTISIIALWFKIIDEFFADPLKYSDPYSTGISLAIASLVIIFPLFIMLLWILRKDEAKYPEKRELGIRKWLIYLTLFIAGSVIVIDLITLIQTFLSGREITGSFIAKVFVVLIVVGMVFVYYIQKTRSKDGISKMLAKWLTCGTILFVIVSISIGFVVMGSPQTQRMKRFDQQRISDLQNIQFQIINHWQSVGRLPETIDTLNDSISGYVAPVDPKTDESYEYRVKSEIVFELCANFDLKSEGNTKLHRGTYYPYGNLDSNWEHKKGIMCFERTINPKLYPNRKNITNIPIEPFAM
jgi:NADH:ubiquinone oxidoreductase subunit 6 (subunit J)